MGLLPNLGRGTLILSGLLDFSLALQLVGFGTGYLPKAQVVILNEETYGDSFSGSPLAIRFFGWFVFALGIPRFAAGLSGFVGHGPNNMLDTAAALSFFAECACGANEVFFAKSESATTIFSLPDYAR